MPNFIPTVVVIVPLSLGSRPDPKGYKVMHLGLQLQDQHSSSTESADLPHLETTAMGKKTSSQDQCASSESVHDEGKHVQDMQSVMVVRNPELSISVSHAEISHPMVQYPYAAYPDPYLSGFGLYTAYGPHAMYQPRVMGAVAPGRVPIPADLPEEGAVYVNAKQYHGILRRRQTRAKLEAQNKLVKNRRPYLHESRHQHARNRVRGTGGRFLSKRNSESHPPTSSENVPDSFHFDHQQGSILNTNYHHPCVSSHHGTSSAAEGATVSSSDAGFQHMVIPMQGGGGGGLVYNGNRHYASLSIVR